MATNASRYTDQTGKAFEYLCEHLLDVAKYSVEEQICIGLRPTGGNHNTDLIVDENIIISLKYQDVAGTAEEKIPYEQICLQHAIETYSYSRAIIVLAGPGWKHDECYRNNCLSKWLITPDVTIMNFDEFLNEFNLHNALNTLQTK
jgi:hypothetical protein